MPDAMTPDATLKYIRVTLQKAMNQTQTSLATWDRSAGVLTSILIDGTSWRWYAAGYVVPAGRTFVTVTATGGGVWVQGVVPGAVNPNLLLGVTGGTADHAVYLLDDGVTARDLHVSFVDEIGYKRRLWKDKAGLYWQPGSNITEPAGTGLTPGRVRALAPQTDVTGAGFANYRDIDPKLATPVDLTPSANQTYLELGKIYSPTQWQFLDTMSALTGVQNPLPRYDALTVASYPYPDNTQRIPQARWQTDLWAVSDITPDSIYETPFMTNATYPRNRNLTLRANGTGHFLAADKLTGLFADGQVHGLLIRENNSTYMGMSLRASGAAGSETCLMAQINIATGEFRVMKFVAGVQTVLLKAGGGTASLAGQALAGSTGYRVTFETFQTYWAAKYWPASAAEPVNWQLIGFQNAVLGSGYAGWSSNGSTTKLTSYGVVVNRGAQAPLTGTT